MCWLQESIERRKHAMAPPKWDRWDRAGRVKGFICVGNGHRREMARFADARAPFSDGLPIPRWLRRFLGVSGSPHNDPLRAAITGEPYRRVYGGISLAGHQFSALIAQMVAHDLDGKVLQFRLSFRSAHR
jgi:hypothetical protein